MVVSCHRLDYLGGLFQAHWLCEKSTAYTSDYFNSAAVYEIHLQSKSQEAPCSSLSVSEHQTSKSEAVSMRVFIRKEIVSVHATPRNLPNLEEELSICLMFTKGLNHFPSSPKGTTRAFFHCPCYQLMISYIKLLQVESDLTMMVTDEWPPYPYLNSQPFFPVFFLCPAEEGEWGNNST